MARPRGNNVPPSFALRYLGAASDVSLEAEVDSSPYLPQCVHLLDAGTYVLEFEGRPRAGEPRHTATIVLTADNVPLTLKSPVAVLKAATTNDVQLVAEY
jgi:hypothetical protein